MKLGLKFMHARGVREKQCNQETYAVSATLQPSLLAKSRRRHWSWQRSRVLYDLVRGGTQAANCRDLKPK